MNECERLAEQYERALNGGAWHGPSFRDVLDDVSVTVAVQRASGGAHSIAEIVLHTVTWLEVVRQRLAGETPQVSDAEDWAEASFADAAAWNAARDRLFQSGRALCDAISAFPVAQLTERRPGLEDTWYGLVTGELQHLVYHAGQIAILRRVATATATSA